MGLYDKVNPTKPLTDLAGTTVKILSAKLEKNFETEYGRRTRITLVVEEGEESVEYVGFSAGIMKQVQQSQKRDFPTVARIEWTDLGEGKSTLMLTPGDPEAIGAAEEIPF